MTGRLEGKRAFITGTGSGQGRAAALLFAAEGAVVAGCDLDPEGAAQTVALVEAAGGTMVSSTVDLADGDQVECWIEAGVRDLGGIDVLYNNASAPRFAAIEDLSGEDWHFTLRNELDLVFWACVKAWPRLRAAGGGVILNTASISAHIAAPGPGALAHAAAKAGVVGMTRQLAVEGAPHGIRANSISPGTIDTPANDALKGDPAVWEVLMAGYLIKRMGTPEEVAQCALYLCSDEAAWVTGADFAVDGGVRAW